jgi:hypothetical protein
MSITYQELNAENFPYHISFFAGNSIPHIWVASYKKKENENRLASVSQGAVSIYQTISLVHPTQYKELSSLKKRRM